VHIQPIIIKTGKKLKKFWSLSRMSVTSIMLAMWIATFHFYFNFTIWQQICGLSIFAATTCLTHAIHHKKNVTLEYSLNMLGLYCYQTSFTNSHYVHSKRICNLVEIGKVYMKENKRCVFKHLLIMETPNKIIKIRVFDRVERVRQLCDDIDQLKHKYLNIEIYRAQTAISNSAKSLNSKTPT
jgi:hypothetical protein